MPAEHSNAPLPEGYAADGYVEDRQSTLDELCAVAAIYGPEAFSTPSAELRAFLEGGDSDETLDAATPLVFDLKLQVEGDDAQDAHSQAEAVLKLHCELPREGYPSCRPASITGALERPGARRPWEDHDLLNGLLLEHCRKRVGEEAICEVIGEALEWVHQRCAQDLEPEPEPEPESEPQSDNADACKPSKLSKYERSRKRHADMDRQAQAIANPGAGVLVGVVEANQGAIRHAATLVGLQDAGFDVEVKWTDGSTTMVRAKDVATRLRPPLDQTVAKTFEDMPPLESFDVGAKVRCLFDGTWQKATINRSMPAADVQVAEVQSDAQRNQRFEALTAKLEKRDCVDEDENMDDTDVVVAAGIAAELGRYGGSETGETAQIDGRH